jgi:rhomboid protease GluP
MHVPPDRAQAPALGDEALPATSLDIASQALLRDTSLGWRVELVGPGWIGLRSIRGRVGLLDGDTEPAHLALGLERIRSGAFPARYVVVLGGEPHLRERLAVASSELATRGIWLLHADGVQPVWQTRQPAWRERRLTRALAASAERAFERRTWPRAEAEAHARRLEIDRVLARSEADDFERFRSLLTQGRPRATLILVAVIAAVFALQLSWGGTELPPLLTRMGSLVPARVRAGEWWRFFSCTFLHGGVLHVGLNALVLYMLGRSLERFLGSTRFVLIYFAAGLAGSASSALFVSSQSVGASGAIWGLLGAEAALAFYPRPLLPPALVGLSRRAAAASLGVNLVISFNPHVDLAAHVGGGLMGAAVLVSLALLGRLSSHGRAAPPVGWLLRGLAGALAAAFAVGLVVAITQGRPWALDAAPELERVSLPGSPWSVEIPQGRTARAESDRSSSTVFGNLAYDPIVVEISWLPLSSAAREREPLDELAAIARQLLEMPEGLEQLIPPRVVADAARPGRSSVTVRYRFSGDAEQVHDLAIGVVDGMQVNVNVSGWAELPRAFDGLAPRILRSLEPVLAESAPGGSVFHSGVPSPRRVGEGHSPEAWQRLGNLDPMPFPRHGNDESRRRVEPPRVWGAPYRRLATPTQLAADALPHRVVSRDDRGSLESMKFQILWQSVATSISYNRERQGTLAARRSLSTRCCL